MTEYDLGKVVGDDGATGADGSTLWYTSTAPTYANSKYTFTISNLSGKTGLDIAANDIIFYSTYYYIVSAVNSTTVDCTTRVSIKGADASVTVVDNLNSDSSTSVLSAKQGKVLNTNKIETSAIATSFGSTTSDSKVPSEKLTKTSLDDKISKSNTSGLVKNDGTIDTTSYSTFSGSYSDLSNKPSIPASSSDLSDGSDLVKTSSTTGLIKNDGSIDTTTYLSSLPSHTHGNLSNDGKIGSNANYIVVTTTGGAITSVQKLGNITYDGKIGSNANYFVYTTTSGQVTSKQKIGNIDTSGAIGSTSGLPIKTGTSGILEAGSFGTTAGTFAEGNHTHSGYISTSSTTGLIKNDGTVMTSGTGSSNYSAGNHTHSGMLTSSDIANNLTTSTTGKVLDASQGKALADLIGDAITYINQ